eukprot:TRINITY_DN19433_c0_g1_i1.p1 TRINITY_DN19433_c0_g1~~TRINITY_DN19433_c0_g1_i1.p1  ORF type:complete len:641 (+),score=147.23 TRINITY_DN19433_c0_g1_i1:1024-2946(+)
MEDLQKRAKEIMDNMANPFKPKFKGQGHRLGGPPEAGAVAAAAAARAQAGSNSNRAPGGSSNRNTGNSSNISGTRSSGNSSSNSSSSTSSRGPSGPRGGELSGASRPTPPVSGAGNSRAMGNSLGSSGGQQPPARTAAPLEKPTGAFDAFQPHFGSGGEVRKTASATGQGSPGGGGASYACPVCQKLWPSEEAVSDHVEECLASNLGRMEGGAAPPSPSPSTSNLASALRSTSSQEEGTGRAARQGEGAHTEAADSLLAEDDFSVLHHAAARFLSGDPPQATSDIITKLLCNIVNDPGSEKFRRIRMSNPKIADSIGKAVGGVELLQAVGFALTAEQGDQGEEVFAVLGEVSERQVAGIKEVIGLLVAQRQVSQEAPSASQRAVNKAAAAPATSAAAGSGIFSLASQGRGDSRGESGLDSSRAAEVEAAERSRAAMEAQHMRWRQDRRMRVFLPSPENVAARIEIPESFFERNGEEMRAEALARRRQMENSQVLMTRASREKQATLQKRRYLACLVRVQLPDMLLVEGCFHPTEPTSALYEFVAEALADPSQEFQLAHPIPLGRKSPIIPSVAQGPRLPIPTLEDAELVPAALVKFRATDIGEGGYTGLRKDLLLAAQPLTAGPYPVAEKVDEGRGPRRG